MPKYFHVLSNAHHRIPRISRQALRHISERTATVVSFPACWVSPKRVPAVYEVARLRAYINTVGGGQPRDLISYRLHFSHPDIEAMTAEGAGGVPQRQRTPTSAQLVVVSSPV